MPLILPKTKPVSFLSWEGAWGAFLRRTDWWTILALIVLTAWGIAAIYSTNSLRTPAFFGQNFAPRQLVFVLIGWCAYLVVALVEPRIFERYAKWVYLAGILLLLPLAVCAVFNINIGSVIAARYGARRWIILPGFSIQPSEIAKITTLVLLARITAHGVRFADLVWVERKATLFFRTILPLFLWRGAHRPLLPVLPLLVRVFWVAALPFGLIFLQPDLGSALTYVPMVFALLLAASVPFRFFFLMAFLSLPGAAVLTADMTLYGQALKAQQEIQTAANAPYKDPAEAIRGTHRGILPIRNYHRERIMTLFAPELIDRRGIGKSWQPRQARMAVARGGISGQGFGKGTLVQLGWLPETAAHNDFLFSSISEESGFIGASALVALFTFLIVRTLRTAVAARNNFGARLAVGVAVTTAVHVFVNIGMNIGMMPVTGVSLPFLSYGGSFIISCFLLFGMVQSIHRDSRPIMAVPPASDLATT
ncbi:MAG: rod shape-determining protein RodA [Puniceicoccales bacterium]|nr:rod shape-determining protein RodA [Puniceicoccales bacterium]